MVYGGVTSVTSDPVLPTEAKSAVEGFADTAPYGPVAILTASGQV